MSFKRITFLSSLLIVLTLSGVVMAAGDPELRVTVSLDRDTIGLDEYATLSVVISGQSQNLPTPRIPTYAAFELYSQGRSSNINIVNNQVTSAVTYRYLMMPKKPGTFPIGNIAVVDRNRRYQGNEVLLTVLDKGTAATPDLQDQAADEKGQGKDFFMETVVDKKNPYVNEQVTLTLKLYVAVQYYGSPELTEPTTTGFWTELLGNKAPYQQRINNRVYKVVERKYALFPTQTGDLTIGRATIRLTVADRVRRRRDPFDMFSDFFNTGKEVAVSSKAIRVNVRPLPDEDKPANFTGSIGDYDISVSADKRQVDVNQPVTVTVRINGAGNIKAAAEPIIAPHDDFRVYRASSSENITKIRDKIGGTKVYEEVFIPKRPGDLEIPAFTYNYFNPDINRYVTKTTRPIALNVTMPEGYTGTSEIPYGGPDLLIGSSARDIRYIKADIGDLHRRGQLPLLSPLYLVVNGLPVVLLAGTILVRRRRDKLASNVSYARARQAGKMAKKRLSKARSLAQTEKAESYYAEIHLALTSYIADRLDISPYGLTKDTIRELLEQRSVQREVIDGVLDTLQQCDFARFAPATVTQADIDEMLVKAEQLMVRLEEIKLA